MPLEIEEAVHAEFDEYACDYAVLLNDDMRERFTRDPLHFHLRKWLVIKRLLGSVAVDPGSQKWLDVGCGRGELLDLAGPYFAEAMGCDPSVEMLSSTKRIKRFIQCSVTTLPYADRSIDFVTATCVYHHVRREDRNQLAREIRRVLRPNGLCCIIEHNPFNPVTRLIVKRCPVDVNAELLTPHAIETVFEAAGFRTISSEYFLYLPESLFKRLGALETVLRHVPLGGQYAILMSALGK